MECEICEKRCEQGTKVFVKGSDELQLCYTCVVSLRTKKLEYSEERQRYRFGGIRRKNGLLRGRISRDHRLPKGKVKAGI
jgi:ribosome-binding protein aMBF1 (putative translation factor)